MIKNKRKVWIHSEFMEENLHLIMSIMKLPHPTVQPPPDETPPTTEGDANQGVICLESTEFSHFWGANL